MNAMQMTFMKYYSRKCWREEYLVIGAELNFSGVRGLPSPGL